MLKLSRKFVTLAESVLNLECLQSKYPWQLFTSPEHYKIHYAPSDTPLHSFHLLVETNSKDLKVLNQSLSQLDSQIRFPGFSYKIHKDHITISLLGLESDILSIHKQIIPFIQSASTHDYKIRQPLEDLNSILLSSCFETTHPQAQSIPLFASPVLISTSIDPVGLALPGKPLASSAPEVQTYKPSMLLIESPGDSTEVCLAFRAAGYNSPEYFLFKFIEQMMTTDPFLFFDQSKQYNYLNSLLAGVPGIYAHSVKYWPGKNAGLLVHNVECHPLAASFAGAAVVKAMKRVAKEIILYEIERTQALILNSICKNCDLMERAARKNEEVFSGKSEKEFVDFLINVNEDYFCRRFAVWSEAQFPSVMVKGKLVSENVIENMFNAEI